MAVLTRGQILDQSIEYLKPSKFIEYLIPSLNLKPCGLGTWRIRFCPIHWSTRGKLSRLALCDKIDPVQVANSTSRWLFLSASTLDTSSCKPYQANVSALCMVLVEESVPTQVNVVNLYQQAKPNPLTTFIAQRVFTPGTDSQEENQPWTNIRKYFSRSECYTPGPDSPEVIEYLFSKRALVHRTFKSTIQSQHRYSVKNIYLSFVLKKQRELCTFQPQLAVL